MKTPDEIAAIEREQQRLCWKAISLARRRKKELTPRTQPIRYAHVSVHDSITYAELQARMKAG